MLKSDSELSIGHELDLLSLHRLRKNSLNSRLVLHYYRKRGLKYQVGRARILKLTSLTRKVLSEMTFLYDRQGLEKE